MNIGKVYRAENIAHHTPPVYVACSNRHTNNDRRKNPSICIGHIFNSKLCNIGISNTVLDGDSSYHVGVKQINLQSLINLWAGGSRRCRARGGGLRGSWPRCNWMEENRYKSNSNLSSTSGQMTAEAVDPEVADPRGGYMGNARSTSNSTFTMRYETSTLMKVTNLRYLRWSVHL